MSRLAFEGKAISDLSLGYSVDVDPFTGASTLAVPIPAAEAREGMAPELVLAYASGAGNSPYGAGWSLSGLPSIGIDTRQRVPQWDHTDGYQFGNDELVPWLEKTGGTWSLRGFNTGVWAVALYRSRRGSAKTRVERWTHVPTGRVHFRTRDAFDRVTVYGARSDKLGRVADPADETRTFAWLPELVVDARGNAMWIEYAAETADGIERGAPFERRVPSLAQRYLKRVRYANRQPVTVDDNTAAGAMPAGMRWCFQVVVDYGDHSDPNAPLAVPDRAWLRRADPFSVYSCGFEVRTYRLCRRFLTFHEFAELGPAPVLTQALVLEHAADPAGSTLTKITHVGSRVDAGVTSRASLPPLRLTYGPAATDTGFIAASEAAGINAPAGIADRRYSLVDLYGEGLPGILYHAHHGWYYKSNQGGGTFGEQVEVAERPAALAGAFACGDVDADGNTELAQLGGRDAGLYELDRAMQRWQSFRPYQQFPHTEALSAAVRWVDLNGDRRADLVVTKRDCFTWFASDGEGFLPPVDLPMPPDAEGLPTLADDPALDFLFADMTGDGLVDLVRVRNGSVEYWPALGNGRFGERVVMDGVPRFAPDDAYDATRIRLVDLDGSGTTDILYVGDGEVSCWINARGNRLVRGPQLAGLPFIDSLSSARVLDFLGEGRPCLVWSSPLPGREAFQYLRLAPATQPRLLLSVNDSLGRLTELTYSSSGAHYLRDVRSGRGWLNRLPGHRMVVDRRDVRDLISNTVATRRFEYHDGYYDGEERELRGFAQVDIYDSPPEEAAPAVLVKHWFHVGTPLWDYQLRADFYRGDPQLPVVPPQLIDDPAGLSSSDIEDGLRALAGRSIREETYAVAADGAPAAVPFDVVQRCWSLRTLQIAQGDRRAAFSVLAREHITWVYEQEPLDPRVHHEILIESDAVDRPLREVSIGYARRPARPADIDAQSRYCIRVRDSRWLNFDVQSRHEIGIPIESRSYELAGLRPLGALFTRGQFTAAPTVAALTGAGRHDVDLVDNPILGPTARLIGCEQTFYWDDARAAPCALGAAGALTLLHHEEAACFEPAFVTDVFGARVDNTLLGQLGYVLRDAFWWQPDETHRYTPANQFTQLASLTRGDGATTQFAYDAYHLVQVRHVDALGNELVGVVDYFELAPWRITDPNGAVAEVRYDALGVIVLATNYGHMGANAWGFDPLPAGMPAGAVSVNAVVTNAAAMIQSASRRVWYDLEAWSTVSRPTSQVVLTREALVHDGAGGGVPVGPVRVVVSYVDGFGRVLQEKQLVDAGPAIARDGANNVVVDGAGRPVVAAAATRWRCSGHVTYDTKQRPLRQFEPFFTTTANYEPDAVLQSFGTAITHHYDVLGRSIGDDLPNGSFTRTAYRSWRVERADPNDTVVGSAYGAMRQFLPAGNPERQAYDHAAAHAGTLQIEYLDPLARTSGHLTQGGATAPDRLTMSRINLDGCELEVVDPRGIVAFRSRYDMQDQPVQQRSADGGESWCLTDAYGRDTNTWDARGFAIVRSYDRLDRPLSTHVTGGDDVLPLDHRIEEWVYGESLANRPDAIRRNLLGHAVTTRDGAQQITVRQCDPTGHVARLERQVRTVVDSEPDWRGVVPLEPTVFSESATFDGMGRPLAETLADGSVRTFSYSRSGAVDEVRVTTPDGSVANVPVLAATTINARGQPLSRTLGNGVRIDWAYDPDTYREMSQIAVRGARTLQQIQYTYDPVGNIVRHTDAAQEGAGSLITGVTVPARRDYAYDAHYRLRQATGRVHQALLQNDFVPGAPGTIKGTRHLTLNNGAALERFTRNYDFDASGNLLSIQHVGASRNWTTGMWVSPASNRSLPALDLNGIAVVNPAGKFDAAGNLVSLAHLRTTRWNWHNSLARAVVIARPGGTDDAEQYAYGADFKRVRKRTTRVVQAGQVEVTEVLYFHDLERRRVTRNGNLVLERWSLHVNDGAERVGIVHRWTRDDANRDVDNAPTARVHYQLATHQASVAVELDQAGALLSYEEYFPYGATAFIAGDSLRDVARRDYRYSGNECDDFTGLYAYGYRYYAPWMGRWLSPDPSGPADDLNLYQFALGDPVRNVDPDGLDTEREPGVRTHVTQAVAPTDSSDAARVAATRASLAPQLQMLFDSLSDRDKLRFAKSNYDLALVARDLDHPEAGGELLSLSDFKNKFIPKAKAWAKKNHIDVGIDVPVDGRVDPSDEPGGGVGGGEGGPGDALPTQDKKKDTEGDGTGAGKGTGEGAGGKGAGEGEKDKNAAGASGGGDGTVKGASTGSGSGPGVAAGQGDGTGTGEKGHGTGPTAGPGAGAGAGASGPGGPKGDAKTGVGGGQGSGRNLGTGRKKTAQSGASILGSILGAEVGGSPDGVLGGTPFGDGNAHDGRYGGALTHGADDQGQAGTARRRGRHGQQTDAPGGGDKNPGTQAKPGTGAGRGTGQGAPTGSGGPPGGNTTGKLTGSAAAQPNPNSNATGHGSGDGGGNNKTGDSGALAVALQIAGYTNLEFGKDDPNGQAGGIPGGSGWFKGKVWQFIYLAVSVVGLIAAVKAVVQSVAKGVLGRLWSALRSPRAILREFNLFLREGAAAWRKFWRPHGGVGPGRRLVGIFKALVYDVRNYESTIRRFRNSSFLFKPRWFGTLERIGQRSLYTWEHIIPQSVGTRFPRMRPFINSYLNSFLRVPMEFNSALGNRWGPKLQFYTGAFEALRRSWNFGNWVGERAIADAPRDPPPQPAR